MASDLKENLSSGTLAAQNALQPKTAPIRITVYVESYEDISFWRNILHHYETAQIRFDIQTATHKGKTGALERSNDLLSLKVGEYLIICVDSDYDFLLPTHTATSKSINENPFIFQTYSYSLENLQCFSNSLRLLCTQATKNDKEIIDFNNLVNTFSTIIYKLFLWNLYFRQNDDHVTFPLSAFCEIIKLTDKIDITHQCAEAIDGLKTRVDAKVTSLEKDYPLAIDEINKIAATLGAIGVSETNTYLFVQGHTLKENVILMVLKPVCQLLIAEKFETIKNNAQHATQAENDRNHYKNQKQDISSVLNSNTEFKNCFLYQKIKSDFDKYIATLS